MGQRHQTYVIAKVVPKGGTNANYRCIAGYHHQWCYGSLPLSGARRFLTLVRVPENQEIIREELLSVQGKYGRSGKDSPRMAVPCPYLTFLLASAFCADLEQANGRRVYGSGYGFLGCILNADMSLGEISNDDGITVLDISDLDSPSYCFALHNGGAPAISAREYIRNYYRLPGDQDSNTEEDTEGECIKEDHFVWPVLDSLKGEKCIPTQTLCEVWPSDYKTDVSDASCLEELPSQGHSERQNKSLPSLADLTLIPAISKSLEDGNIEAIEHIVTLPSKLPDILAFLRSIHPFPRSGTELLRKIFASQPYSNLDLSELIITGNDILSIIQHADSTPVDSLNLSGNTSFDVAALREILLNHPKIRRLVLFRTAISNEDLDNLLNQEPKLFYNVEQLIHPAFLQIKSRPTSRNMFGYCMITHGSSPNSFSLPFFNLAALLQGILDFVGPLVNDPPYGVSSGLGNSAVVAMAALSTGLRRSSNPWGERSVTSIPCASAYGRIFCEGWFIVLNHTRAYMDASNARYGFCRPLNGRPDQKYEIYDFKSFLSELETDGHPSPPDELRHEVADIMDKMTPYTEQEINDLIPTQQRYISFVEHENRDFLDRM